jgi:hypothetical protein
LNEAKKKQLEGKKTYTKQSGKKQSEIKIIK